LPFAKLQLAETLLEKADAEYKAQTPADSQSFLRHSNTRIFRPRRLTWRYRSYSPMMVNTRHEYNRQQMRLFWPFKPRWRKARPAELFAPWE
jgi:hypothetical protein